MQVMIMKWKLKTNNYKDIIERTKHRIHACHECFACWPTSSSSFSSFYLGRFKARAVSNKCMSLSVKGRFNNWDKASRVMAA